MKKTFIILASIIIMSSISFSFEKKADIEYLKIAIIPYGSEKEAERSFEKFLQYLREQNKKLKASPDSINKEDGIYHSSCETGERFYVNVFDSYLIIFKDFEYKDVVSLKKQIRRNLNKKKIRYSVPSKFKGDIKSIISFKKNLSGYESDDKILKYNRDNLYELVNGSDSVYLLYGCKHALKNVVMHRESNTTFQVEIFDMTNPANAFGIFSKENNQSQKFVNTGTCGAIDDYSMTFFIDRFYIKIIGFSKSSDETKSRIAKQIIRSINVKPGSVKSIIPWIKLFPDENRISGSEQYQKNVFGFDFFNNGIVISYQNRF